MSKHNGHRQKPLFAVGTVVATRGALGAFEKAGQAPSQFLERHVRGDWGNLCDEDAEANNQALIDGSRLLSAYELSDGEKIWIITEADRSSSCLLRPHEY